MTSVYTSVAVDIPTWIPAAVSAPRITTEFKVSVSADPPPELVVLYLIISTVSLANKDSPRVILDPSDAVYSLVVNLTPLTNTSTKPTL